MFVNSCFICFLAIKGLLQLFYLSMHYQETNQPTMLEINGQSTQNNHNNLSDRYLNVSLPEIRQRDRFVIDAPRQIPKKSYSLAPDMATGWKPKRPNKINFQNVFPLNFTSNIVDQIVKTLAKKNLKYELVFLGPRKSNSYQLHEQRNYQNPYPADKKLQSFQAQRPGINKYVKLNSANLNFSSDYESGNLDVAIKINDSEYDLFMRVDSNTRGHTNWFYFTVENSNWVGSVKFNICNFRRQRSLYQRGMRPYVRSVKQGNQWTQKGYSIEYERKATRYKFLYQQEDDVINQSLSTYYTMTFTYNFDVVGDKVQFAYCIPYTYSFLLDYIREISPSPFLKYQTGWRTLSGLPVPTLQITDFDEPNINKKVVLVTARIHPGQSNSSFVCHGLIKSLLSEQGKSRQTLKKFHFFIVPMLNPDGVVAGNYRTSLFGKDLNRTFNQSRKYAFPEAFSLVEMVKSLKKEHKQRFTIYLDLHGHSVKKNIFFYGPDYSISHSFYSKSRQFAKILGNLTSMFRYYSCIFHISNEKLTTARATFNKVVNIPFTYTLQSSNGAFYDSLQHQQKLFLSKHWIQMGEILVKGLSIWAQNQNFYNPKLHKSVSYIASSDDEQQNQQKMLREKEPPGKQKMSDDQIQQGKSDSQPEDQDLGIEQLERLQKDIEGKTQVPESQSPKKEQKRQLSPQKSERPKKNLRIEFDWSNNLREPYNRKDSLKTKKEKLPPINLQTNPVQFIGNVSQKKRITIIEALKNLTSSNINPNAGQRKKRMSISQMMINQQQEMTGQQSDLILQKKLSRQQIVEKMKKKR